MELYTCSTLSNRHNYGGLGCYQTRGRTRPDTPGEEEYTMITGSQDAMAHRIIDLVGKGKKQTKK